MKHRNSKNSVVLSRSRWLSYAAAGLATASGGVMSAEAEIHYSGKQDVKFDGRRSHKAFPLTGGAKLAIMRTSSSAGEGDYLAVLGARKSASIRGTSFRAEKLYAGQSVASGSFTTVDPRFVQLISIYGYGNFSQPGIGFAGFKFNTGHGTQYGWARIGKVKGPGRVIVLLDYAWADPGETIAAGQTRPSEAVSQAMTTSGSLGLLAFGGQGLWAWRQARTLKGERPLAPTARE